jgi:hypothetical protein
MLRSNSNPIGTSLKQHFFLPAYMGKTYRL